MKIYYSINDQRFIDQYMITDRLQITKSLFQKITKKYPIESKDILRLQNRNIYSVDSVLELVKKIKSDYESQITNA
jgi:hypothetical protein